MTGTNSRKTSLAPIVQRLTIFSALLILVPLVLYPRGFGFPAFDLNPAVGLLEWVFYVTVLSLSAAHLPFSTRVVAAGFTVVFRLTIGVVSGWLTALAHNLPQSQTVVEMMWSYPLALIPHVLSAAVVTTPLWQYLMSAQASQRIARPSTRPKFVTPALSPGDIRTQSHTASASRLAGITSALTQEPSFDDAVSYIGEYSGVRLCWIVDRDGLPIAVWQRQMYTGDADFWAPVSIEMIDFQRNRLSIGGEVCQPDRFEVRTNQGRLVVEAVRDVWLGVLTDPDADELISVRITRAREMIAKHLHAESGQTVAAGEVQYV